MMRNFSIFPGPAAMILLIFSGCTPTANNAPPRIDLTDASLRPHVGERITVSGLWNPAGMQGPYVSRPDKSGDGMIYVKSLKDADSYTLTDLASGMRNGATVELTGVLHWYKSPPVPPGLDPTLYQRAPDHFYLDVADTQIKEVAR